MRDRSIALVVRNGRILSVQTYRLGGYINELPGGGGVRPGRDRPQAAECAALERRQHRICLPG